MSNSDWADGLADTIFPTQPTKREVPLVTNRDEEPVAPPPPIPSGLAGSPEERQREQAKVDRLVNRRVPVTVRLAPKPGYPVNLGKHAQALAAHRRANPVYAVMPCGVETTTATGDGPCVLAAGHTGLGTVVEHVPAKPVVWQYGPQWLAENVAREVLDGEQV